MGWNSEHLIDYDTFIFDCDGVLWTDEEPIEGAVDTLEILERMGKRILFLTNNSTKSRAEYIKKFSRIGINAQVDQVFSSAFASAVYLRQHHPNVRKVLCLGGPGIGHEVRAIGFQTIELRTEIGERHLTRDELVHWEIDSELDAVLIGLDPELTYSKIAIASRVLQASEECIFVSTNRDVTYPAAKGILLPGAGMGVEALEACSGRKAVNVGKPEVLLFEAIQAVHRIDPKRTLMVGDRLDTDIAFGKSAGLDTCLVFSGVSTPSELEACLTQPDFTLETVHGLVSQ